MSRTYRKNQKKELQERHISVRSVRRDPPDLRKLSRAVITLALAEMEAEAEAKAKAHSAPEQQPGSIEPSTNAAPRPGGRP